MSYDSLDRGNVVIVSAAVVLGVCGLASIGAYANRQADHHRDVVEVTEQLRILACVTITDEELRALCIVRAERSG